jgi:hypothetical protein
MKFRKIQARKLAILAFGLSLFIIGTGIIIKNIPLLTGLLFIAFFTVGAFIIGGYHDPNDQNPQD